MHPMKKPSDLLFDMDIGLIRFNPAHGNHVNTENLRMAGVIRELQAGAGLFSLADLSYDSKDKLANFILWTHHYSKQAGPKKYALSTDKTTPAPVHAALSQTHTLNLIYGMIGKDYQFIYINKAGELKCNVRDLTVSDLHEIRFELNLDPNQFDEKTKQLFAKAYLDLPKRREQEACYQFIEAISYSDSAEKEQWLAQNLPGLSAEHKVLIGRIQSMPESVQAEIIHNMHVFPELNAIEIKSILADVKQQRRSAQAAGVQVQADNLVGFAAHRRTQQKAVDTVVQKAVDKQAEVQRQVEAGTYKGPSWAVKKKTAHR